MNIPSIALAAFGFGTANQHLYSELDAARGEVAAHTALFHGRDLARTRLEVELRRMHCCIGKELDLSADLLALLFDRQSDAI